MSALSVIESFTLKLSWRPAPSKFGMSSALALERNFIFSISGSICSRCATSVFTSASWADGTRPL